MNTLKRGFSLLEIVIATAVGATLVFGVMGSMKSCTGAGDKLLSRGDAETEVSQLAETLTQMGKIAQSCKLTGGSLTSAGQNDGNTLQCDVDFNVPPTGSLTKVGFAYSAQQAVPPPPPPQPPPSGGRAGLILPQWPHHNAPEALVQYAGMVMLNPSLILKLHNPNAEAAAPNDLIMQESKNGGSSWTPTRTFKNIQSIVICDDTAMKNNNCSIQPAALSAQHKANLAAAKPTLPGRFYRIQITGVSAKEDAGKLVQIQTSFYQRNPTSVTGLLYQWGMQE